MVHASAERLGSSVLGLDEAHARLLPFRVAWSAHRAPLFFVGVDAHHAFDTVIQSKLCDVVDAAVTADEYMIRRYVMLTCTDGRGVHIACKRQGVIGDSFAQFADFALEASRTRLRGAIVSDQVVYPHVSRSQVLRLVQEHVCNNLIRVGKRFFRARVRAGVSRSDEPRRIGPLRIGVLMRPVRAGWRATGQRAFDPALLLLLWVRRWPLWPMPLRRSAAPRVVAANVGAVGAQ